HHPNARKRPGGKFQPISGQAAFCHPFAPRTNAREIPVLFDVAMLWQSQRRSRGHAVKRLHGRQTFTALLPAAAQYDATAPGGIAGAKAILALAANLRWLIRAFHAI